MPGGSGAADTANPLIMQNPRRRRAGRAQLSPYRIR